MMDFLLGKWNITLNKLSVPLASNGCYPSIELIYHDVPMQKNRDNSDNQTQKIYLT